MIKFLFGIALVGIGFYRTLFVDPIWGIYLFAVLTHIRLNQLSENIQLPLNVPFAIAAVTFFMYLCSGRYTRKFSQWPVEVWLLALMVAGMAVSSSCAHYNPALSWERTVDYAKYWVFFILLVQMVDTLEKIEWFHRTFILSAAWLVYRCWDLRGTTGFRFENLGGDVVADANHYAAAIVLLFPFVFKKTLSPDWRVALGATVGCFGMLMSVFVAVSRGAFLGSMALFLLLVINFKSVRKKVITVSLCLLVTVLAVSTADQKERLFGVTRTVNEETRDASSQGRVDYWKLSWNLFKENVVTGVGIANFPYYSGPALERQAEGKTGHVAHSLWFETLAEGGLLVTVPFLWLLVTFFRKTGRLLRQIREFGVGEEHELYLRTVRVALASFLVSATFINRLVYEPIYWCIALGVAHETLLKQLIEEKALVMNETDFEQARLVKQERLECAELRG